MRVKYKIFNLVVVFLRSTIKIFGGRYSTIMSAHIVEELTPIWTQKTDFGDLRLFCPGYEPTWRAQRLLTKEPDTIDWINTFNETDIFWDIGANDGEYSLYAALKNVTVLSFEPSAGNYYVLNRNIEINKMDDNIFALCIAFDDVTKTDVFFMSSTKLGAAFNSFAEPVDYKGKQYTAIFKQAMMGFSIDDFIEQFNPPFPTHIKIDVDGTEDKIIKGAQKTLADKRLKSILVELDTERADYYNRVFNMIESAGLKFHEKKGSDRWLKNNYFVRVEK